MGYRCVNDLFNYCSDKPEWGKPPKTPGVGLYPAGGSCKLDLKTCGRHQTLHKQVDDRLAGIKSAKETHKAKKGK